MYYSINTLTVAFFSFSESARQCLHNKVGKDL